MRRTGGSDLGVELLHVSEELAGDSLLVVDLDSTLYQEVRDVVSSGEVCIHGGYGGMTRSARRTTRREG